MRSATRRGLAVGFFDGVHLGHQAILGRAAAALTFSSHPLELLAPERAPRLLMGLDDRIAAIRACGVGRVVVMDFTRELAAMPAEAFADALPEEGKSGGVLCGDNWRFGAGGRGDAAFLRARGVAVEVVPYASWRGERISSTRVRAALEAGGMGDAAAMLGRPWSARGEVFAGKGLGSRIGFPTVNVRLAGLQLRLRRGVYAVEACGRRGVANYGVAPTMGEGAWPEPVLEVHFPGCGPAPSPAAGESLSVAFLRFLRPEMRFRSVDELRRRIAADCEALASQDGAGPATAQDLI